MPRAATSLHPDALLRTSFIAVPQKTFLIASDRPKIRKTLQNGSNRDAGIEPHRGGSVKTQQSGWYRDFTVDGNIRELPDSFVAAGKLLSQSGRGSQVRQQAQPE